MSRGRIYTTNEELATHIKAGETDLIPQLWQQIERFVKYQANKVAASLSSTAFVDADDFIQAGYFAMLKAVEAWQSDSEFKFITYLNTHLKNEFAECGGWKTSKGKTEWIKAPLSLDAPIYEDDDGNEITLLDITPCLHDDCERVEYCLYIDECRKAINKALDAIPVDCADAVRSFYLYGKSLSQYADEIGVLPQLIQRRKQQGLRELRKDKTLAKFYYADDDIASAAMKCVGLDAYNRKRSSATERVALRMAMGLPVG